MSIHFVLDRVVPTGAPSKLKKPGAVNQEMLQKYKTYEKYKEVLSGTLAYDAMGSNFDAPAAVPALVRRRQLYRDMKGLVRSCK